MKQWSIDKSSFKNKEEKEIWELEQRINYGLNDTKLPKDKLVKYWHRLKDTIDPYARRALEFLLWGKIYSLPTNLMFWNWSPKTKI